MPPNFERMVWAGGARNRIQLYNTRRGGTVSDRRARARSFFRRRFPAGRASFDDRGPPGSARPRFLCASGRRPPGAAVRRPARKDARGRSPRLPTAKPPRTPVQRRRRFVGAPTTERPRNAAAPPTPCAAPPRFKLMNPPRSPRGRRVVIFSFLFSVAIAAPIRRSPSPGNVVVTAGNGKNGLVPGGQVGTQQDQIRELPGAEDAKQHLADCRTFVS